jgi:hypothetical protein
MERLKMEQMSEVRQGDRFYPHRKSYVVGVDLGQSQDPTALCVIEHADGVTDPGSDYEVHTGITRSLQKKAQQNRVIRMERPPLNTSYSGVVQHVKQLLDRDLLRGNEDQKPAELVIDAGGVGRGVADMFRDAGMKPICVTITGGLETTCTGPNRYNVAKHALITDLDALIHHPDHPLRFSKHLREQAALAEEIADFTKNTRAAGRNTYEARQGRHDDMVLAVALAAWWISRPKPQPAGFGYWGRSCVNT